MLSTLASYLLGSQSSEQAAVAPDVRLRAVETDDDWMLVETAGAATASATPPLSLVLRPSATPGSATPTAALSRSRPLSRASSASSLPCEDSWFVTPPPCFTSAGPVHMETSPLEDLLIEHPSMSVYQRSWPARAPAAAPASAPPPTAAPRRAGSLPPPSPLPRSPSPSLSPAPSPSPSPARRPRDHHSPPPPPPPQAAAVQPLPRRQNLYALQPSQQQQLLTLRSSQKVQQRRACQMLKRNHLERQNKARENNSRNKVLRRSDYMQHHSGANNNRKC